MNVEENSETPTQKFNVLSWPGRLAYKQIKFLDVFVNTLMGYIERVAARQEEMILP